MEKTTFKLAEVRDLTKSEKEQVSGGIIQQPRERPR